ncbi:MAG TPA: hypothetical protein DCK87_02235 [Desulfotomaculum sp.]|nr:hypothetical protein [Desulfotomaculum sp.]
MPITRGNYGGDLRPEKTINKPKCFFKNTPPPDETAGFDENGRQKKWYSKRSNMYGSVNLTKDCARAMYSFNNNMTSADVMVAFPYGLSMTEMTYTGNRTYKTSVFNTTPYIAKNVKLRAYVKINNNMIKVDEKTVDISATSNESGWGKISYTFTVPLQTEDYQVIATANIDASNGLGGGSILENLITQYAYGPYAGQQNTHHGPSGSQETVPVLPGSGINMNNLAYNDNFRILNTEGETPVPIPPGPEPPAGESNLSIYDMHVYDKETGQDVTNPTFNQTLGIKASYKSTFDVGGWARLRFYRYYEGYYNSLTQIGDNVNYYFEPGADVTYDYGQDYGFRITPGQYEIIASIDYYNNGNNPDDNWQTEKFDGKYDETTYDDNKMARDLTGSDVPYVPPTPTERSESVWYPPLAWVEVPGEIHTHTEKEDIYGWKEIPLTKDMPEAKKKVRLVPNIKD